MKESRYPSYSRQRLIFFVAQEHDEAIVNAVREAVEALSATGAWVLLPPVFIDDVAEAPAANEDHADRTVGAMLDILGASDGLPGDLDAATLADVTRLVHAAQAMSERLSLEIEFELDGEFVGAIDAGILDTSLAEGLLGEWRRRLG